MPYGIQQCLFTDIGSRFKDVFSIAAFDVLVTQLQVPTAYQPWMNSRLERYNKTIFYKLQHNIEEHENYGDAFISAFTYSNNEHVHK